MSIEEGRIGRLAELSARKYFPEMENSNRVVGWIKKHTSETIGILEAYDGMIKIFNQMPADDPLLNHLEHSQEMKKLLNGMPLPESGQVISELGLWGFLGVLKDAKPAVLQGQVNKTKRIRSATINEVDGKFAIGTTSISDISDEHLVAGTLGHLAVERQIMESLTRKGKQPESGWKKDDVLAVIDEMVIIVGKDGPLYKYFTGKLGWLKEEKVQAKRQVLGLN